MPKGRKFRKKDPKSLKKKSKSSRFNNLEAHSDKLDILRSHKKKRQTKHEQPLKSIRTALFHILNYRWNGKRKKQLPAESQEFCSRLGNIYTKVLELALEMDTADEDTEMEWQYEPTTPVHLVRTREEDASYPDGAVVSPWQMESSTTYRSALSESDSRQSSSSIDDTP
ncbi:hypothetical protein NW768_006905 [Fusarium equiseti]|uniref:Uncharacterized protein n=1 Tax=Fusarium equiseti TaxID=61235 RepID=A0ABQ8R9H9_FUSEQ|nr:hypothetical protein NW768_006905 [Fusarium equiseti]